MLSRYLLWAALLLAPFGALAQAALTRLSNTAVPGYAVELAVSGTTAYVLTANAGLQRLQVYDVSVPTLPRLLSTLDLPSTKGLPPRHAAVSNNTLYVSTYPFNSTPRGLYLLAIDVSNPTAPTVRQTTTAIGGDELFVAAVGTYVYTVLDKGRELSVHDSNLNYITNITLPYSLSGILGLTSTGTTAYVQYANPAFATLDLTTPTVPVSSPGTTPGTISTASGPLAYGLQQPAYQNSVPTNALRFYNVSAPLAPAFVRTLPGSFGTEVVAGTNSVFTVGLTSPYLAATATSTEPLRGYYLPASGAAAPLEAFAVATQGANALAVVGNTAYVLTDTNLAIYSFPTLVTATRSAATLTALPIYPNPARDRLSLPHLAPGSPVVIYDVAGRACLQAALSAHRTLDISALSAGLYHVRAGAATRQLLVE